MKQCFARYSGARLFRRSWDSTGCNPSRKCESIFASGLHTSNVHDFDLSSLARTLPRTGNSSRYICPPPDPKSNYVHEVQRNVVRPVGCPAALCNGICLPSELSRSASCLRMEDPGSSRCSGSAKVSSESSRVFPVITLTPSYSGPLPQPASPLPSHRQVLPP